MCEWRPRVRSSVEPDVTSDEITLTVRPWVTIVWNDPVNLMSYVTYVFQTYFGYDQEEGGEADARGAPRRPVGGLQRVARGDGARRAGDARVRPVGDPAEGRPHERLHPPPPQRTRSSPPSPASRPTCCAPWPASSSSCCATRPRCRTSTPTRSRPCSSFDGPTAEPDDPVLARLFPTAYGEDEEAAGGLPPLHRGRPARRQGGRCGHHHRHPRGGGSAARARATAARASTSSSSRTRPMTWLRVASPTCDWPSPRGSGRGGRRGVLGVAARRRPAGPGRTTSTTGSGYLQETLVDALG